MNKDKIQQVIKKMLDESDKIKSVTTPSEDYYDSQGEEYYFYYPNDKYLWSLTKNSEGENYIFYYPYERNRSIFIRFGSDEMDLSTKQDLQSLFEVIRGKLFGFDGVLDDILNESNH